MSTPLSPDDQKQVFANRVRSTRTGLGLTQTALGAAIGVSDVSIHQLESGKILPSFNTFTKLAAVLGVTMDYLAGRDLDYGHYVIPTWLAPWLPGINSLKGDDRKTLRGVAEALIFRNKARQSAAEPEEKP
jgi:putative transcriptional regulator